MIPDVIDLPVEGHQLYLEGGINGPLDITENYVALPLDLSL